MIPEWTTACPDWDSRIVAGESLIPFKPLFPAEAEAGLAIFRKLRLVDVAGQPTMGEASPAWVLDFVAAIFGSYDSESGRRLIRYFFLLIAKKNAKSTLAAGIMVTALVRNWRMSGEFYILAPTKEIADNSFFPARDMVLADEDLKALLNPNPGHRLITHYNTGAFLKVVAADTETVGGKKTIGLFRDELHLFGKRASSSDMFREAQGGLASRPEGFVIDATTQGIAPPTGVFDHGLKKFRDIRDGKLVDRRSFGLLYEYPQSMIESGEFKDPENWYIPNPNLDRSVDREYLLEQQADAEQKGRSELIGFYAKHLNVQPGIGDSASTWAGAQVWDRGIEKGLTLESLLDRSEVVTIGVDGGGLDDLLGIGVIGREKGTKRWLAWTHALISPEGLERRKANITVYEKFQEDEDLTIVAALPDDITYVVEIVRKVRDRGLLAQVGVDAAGIGGIVDALAQIGITQEEDKLGAVRQGIALMGAIKTIERKLVDKSFVHSGQAMMAWCVSNAKVVQTPTAQRIARDEAGYGKIDPLMALFNAAALMSMNPVGGGSIFEHAAWWDTPKNVAVPAQG